jgi:uncharacterized membrane protein YphA (DoxX/SURF4 family)
MAQHETETLNNIESSSRKFLDLSVVITVLRYVIALVFLMASLTKISHPYSFYEALLAYQLPFPDQFLRFAAMVLPWMELQCAFLLMMNVKLNNSLAVVGVLLVISTVFIGSAYLRGLKITCGCIDFSAFGMQDTVNHVAELPQFAIVRNLILLAMVALLLSSEQRNPRRPDKLPAMDGA